MKKTILILIVTLLCLSSHAQYNREIDSLWHSYNGETIDTNRVRVLWNLSNAYVVFKPDTALLLSWQALLLSRKEKWEYGESWTMNQMAAAYNKMGNYPRALEYYIKQLKIEEKYRDPGHLANIDMSIAQVYQSQKDHKNALVYALKADSMIDANIKSIEYLKVYSLINLGDIYEKLNMLKSALDVTFKAYTMAEVKNMDFLYGPCLNNLGNIYAKMDNTVMAYDNYRNGLPFLISSGNEDFMCETYLGMAKLFLKENKTDSAEHYARLSFLLAEKDEFQTRSLDASVFLSKLFHKKNNIDSAFFYQDRMVSIKDSIYSSDRIRQALSLSLEEQLRQIELANEQAVEKLERRKKLQLLSIGLFLPLFFLLTLYLNKKKVHARYVEFAGILSLLLFFEYISILIHPFVLKKTSHIPVLELMVFVVIAAILTPLHQRIEHWMIRKLGRKHEHKESPSPAENKA